MILNSTVGFGLRDYAMHGSYSRCTDVLNIIISCTMRFDCHVPTGRGHERSQSKMARWKWKFYNNFVICGMRRRSHQQLLLRYVRKRTMITISDVLQNAQTTFAECWYGNRTHDWRGVARPPSDGRIVRKSNTRHHPTDFICSAALPQIIKLFFNNLWRYYGPD